MKKFNLFTFVLLFFLSFESFAQSGNQLVITEPVKYNDYIVNEQNAIGEKIINLMGIVSEATSTHETAMAALQLLSNTIDNSIRNLENLKTYDPDFGMKVAAMDLFQFYHRIIQNQYVQLINELYTEQPNVEKINGLVDQVSVEEKGFDDAFQAAEQKFADANNITLEKNELQESFEEKTE